MILKNQNRSVKIVLVEPSGTINLGSIARLCQNFGINELRLVEPCCDPQNEQAMQMAVRGKSLLENAKVFSCLLDAISDCNRVIATCGRINHGEIPLLTTQEALPWLLDTSEGSTIALVFGREDRGLTNQELQMAHKVITLKANPSYPSLNLSHAVAVVLHELYRFTDEKHNQVFRSKRSIDPASSKQLNECLEDAESLLLEIGFLLDHTSQARMKKIKAILHRAEVRPEEVSLIRGILRQFRWAIQSRRP